MIKLRPATILDLDLLLYLDKKQNVIDNVPGDDWNWQTELKLKPEWREQLIAEINGTPIGFVQIIDPFHEETHYWGNVEKNKRAIDIWIGEEENLNKGYGTQMMKNVIEKCFDDQAVSGILIDPLKSNTEAHRFYERLGFEFVKERKFDDSLCYVYELRRSTNSITG